MMTTRSDYNGVAASGDGTSSTLGEAMRAPGSRQPNVVVLVEPQDEDEPVKEVLNPKEDLWMTGADGRFSSPIITIRVGQPPHVETFHVHKNILLKTAFFRNALTGQFKESLTQSVDLPEDDPALFHFIVAFLYEGTFVPIRPVADVLDGEEPKARELIDDTRDSDSDSVGSDDSLARERRRIDRRRRRQERHFEYLREKHPGHHRQGCDCPRCLGRNGPACWRCHALQAPAPIVAPAPGVIPPRPRAVRDRPVHAGRPLPGTGPVPGALPHLPTHALPPPDFDGGPLETTTSIDMSAENERIRGEDMRTWLLTYELSLQVYICANKYMMDDMKHAVERHVIDMLETAGNDAAVPEVLNLCGLLCRSLPPTDQLLHMILARVGFLQPLLCRRAPQKTADFLAQNPEVTALMLQETVARQDGTRLPAMQRSSWMSSPASPYGPPQYRPVPPAPRYGNRGRY